MVCNVDFIQCIRLFYCNFKGAECQHSLSYWTGSDYIGIGPGTISNQKLVQCMFTFVDSTY